MIWVLIFRVSRFGHGLPPERPSPAPPPPAAPAPAPSRAYHHRRPARRPLLTAAEALLTASGSSGRTVAQRLPASACATWRGRPGSRTRRPITTLPTGTSCWQRGRARLSSWAQRYRPARQPRPSRANSCWPSPRPMCILRATARRFRLMFGPLLATRAQHPALDHAWPPPALRVVCCWAPPSGSTPLALPLALTGWSLAHGLSHLLLDEAFGLRSHCRSLSCWCANSARWCWPGDDACLRDLELHRWGRCISQSGKLGRVLALLSGLSAAAATEPAGVAQLAWLSGCWRARRARPAPRSSGCRRMPACWA